MKLNLKLRGLLLSLSAIVFAIFSSALCFCLDRNKPDEARTATVAYIDSDTSNDIISRLIIGGEPQENLDLSNTYPIFAENQQSSLLCWAYAASKSLETSIMIQGGEFVNFSEVGAGLLLYKQQNNDGTFQEIFPVGNFKLFNSVAQNYGLIYENDFSNDNYNRITASNVEEYLYVQRFADKSISKQYFPIDITETEAYKIASSDNKLKILKSFISHYGGMFAGINGGYVYRNADGFAYYSSTDEFGGRAVGAHAVCIIGYDEVKGFLALNSWGVDSTDSYEKFYIPYKVDGELNSQIFDTFEGYVLTQNENITAINIEKTSANSFTKDILDGEKSIKNIFTSDEISDFSITYSLDVISAANFKKVYVSITNSSVICTDEFLANYNDDAKTVTLSFVSELDLSDFKYGTYLVKFYDEQGLVGVKTLYFYTGTEVLYSMMYYTEGSNITKIQDSVSLMNSYASGVDSATFYVPARTMCLDFYLSYLSRNCEAKIKDFYLVSGSSGNRAALNNSGEFYIDDALSSEEHITIVMQLNKFAGSMVEFRVELNSENVIKTFNIKIMVSSNMAAKTSSAFDVRYNLDGGKNDERNVQKLPVYADERSMTKIPLYDGTKTGYTFLGWYLNPDFSGEKVTMLDDKFSSNITLFAKWVANANVEFDAEISTNSEKEKLIYGDEFDLYFAFKESDNLKDQEYAIIYSLYVNGAFITENSMSGESNINIKFSFTYKGAQIGNKIGVDAGDFDINIIVQVVKDHSVSYSKNFIFSSEIYKREITGTFVQEKVEYDGKFHLPKFILSGVLAGDEANAIYDKASVKDSGTYEFKVIGLDNKNYVLDRNFEYLLEITKKSVSATWSNLTAIYSSTSQYPSISFSGLVDKDVLDYYFTTIWMENKSGIDCVSAGEYTLQVNIASNSNYYIESGNIGYFKILPYEINIVVDNIIQRVQTDLEMRKLPTYTILNSVFYGDSLGLSISSDGVTATKSGVYPIKVNISNPNYTLNIIGGQYTLTGHYFVYYTLPNGEIYVEQVEEGRAPSGVNSKIYKKPFLTRFVYSTKLEMSSEDMYVTVSTSSYAWAVAVASAAVVLGALYFIFRRSSFGNKVR